MKDKIVIVGMGKVSGEVRTFIEEYELFDIIAFSVNSEYMDGPEHDGLPVYPLEHLEDYIDKSKVYTFVAASDLNYLSLVKRDLYNYLKTNGFMVANLISPKADIHTKDYGDGNWFCGFSYIHYDTKIGSNNTFRPFSYLAHYSSVGSHNYIGVQSVMAGNSHCVDQCFFGVASTVFNTLTIGDKCIIGARTIVKKNVPNYCLCKMVDGDVVVDQYGPLSIELKLAPQKNPTRKTYEVNIKSVE